MTIGFCPTTNGVNGTLSAWFTNKKACDAGNIYRMLDKSFISFLLRLQRRSTRFVAHFQ
jgi:hypothetical protein